MKVDKNIVVNELMLPYIGVKGFVDIISDTIVEKGRWNIYHELIVWMYGKYYKAEYSVGATENQDEYPWDDVDYVEFKPIRKVMKMVEVWEECGD